MNSVVDLKPLIDVGVQVLGGVLLALASWALAWAGRHFKMLRDQHLNDALHAGLDRAVNYAIQAAQREGDDHRSLAVRNKIVIDAVGYATRYLPEVVAKFGLAPADVEKLVLAHLPDLSAPPELPPSPADVAAKAAAPDAGGAGTHETSSS